MRGKLKISTLLWAMYILIVLIDIRFFYYKFTNQILELVLAMAMIGIMYLGTSSLKTISHEMPFIQKLCLTTVACFFCVFVYSILKYRGQGLYTTFTGESANYKMLLIVLMYPIAYFLMKFGVKKVFKMLNVLAGIVYVISIIQFTLYNVTGTIFLPAISLSGDPFLYGTLRITIPWLGYIMILYNFYMFFIQKPEKKRAKVLYFSLFLLGFIDSLMIARVRGATIVIVPCLVINVFLNRTTSASLVKKVGFIIGICLFAFLTDYIGDFFETFSLTATRSYSTVARLYALDYYWKYYLDHPLFGFGFADGVRFFSIVHGDGRALISDVGIFGQLGKYGSTIILIYVYPLIRSFVIMFKARRSKKVRDISFFITLGLFILGSSFSLICIDQMRMLLWPFYITLIEYVYYVHQKDDMVLEL